MRKIIALLFIVILVATACKKGNFLDNKSSTLIDVNAVFTDSARTIGFLNRMYEEIGFNFDPARWEGSGNTQQGTDVSEYNLSNPDRRSVALAIGAYDANNFKHADAWAIPYINIRRANLLMSKLPTTPLSPIIRSRIMGECKFMRAYFYTYLILNFGGVPIVGDTLYDETANINLPRGTFEECVNYCVKEYDEAAELLPAPYAPFVSGSTPFGQQGYEDRDYGRVTRGACMAMKARLLFHAASPLFNGGAIAGATEEQKKIAGYPTYSATRWQTAADVIQALMATNWYALTVDNTTKPGFGFYNMFLQRYPNREQILVVNRPPNRDFEAHFLPSSRGGQFYIRPTQNAVNSFGMKNGKSITDPTSGYNPANPYINRDPRFNYTIIFNGSRYQRANTGIDSVFTWSAETGVANNAQNNSGDGWIPGFNGVQLTGYYCRKMCDSNIANNSSGQTVRGWPLLRYAEMVLSYAEAMNELGNVQMATSKLIEIRNRAGIDPGPDGLYGIKPNITQAELRELIRNERHVELMYEGDSRWNDVRRWKIAEVTNNGFLKGIRILRNPATRAYTYQVVDGLLLHVFTPKQYLLPIPGLELRRMPASIQNPGWQ